MAFSYSLRAAFTFITATSLLLLVYEKGYVSDSASVLLLDERTPAATKNCTAIKHLQQIIQTINYSAARLFVADPSILASLHDQSSGNSSDLCEVFNANFSDSYIFNVGLLSSFAKEQEVLNEICHPLEKKRFTCSRIESQRISMLNGTRVTHLLIESSHMQLHVACFIKVIRNVYWVQEMQQPTPGALLGTNQSEVYDSFHIHDVEIAAGVTLPVPVDIASFLRQIPTSRFTSCNQEAARNMTSPMDDQGKAVQANTRQSIIRMKKLMSQLGIPFFLFSGSLLGWFRECRAIVYTTDADFATFARFATPKVEDKILRLTHQDPSFRVFDIFGEANMGYEMSFLLRNGFKSDLFFLYEESESRLSSSGHVISERLYYKYFYPSFELCSTIFLSVKVNVPCDPALILSAEYGDWKTPIEDSAYSYRTSPRNRGPAIKYPLSMNPIFREFP